MVPNEVFFFYRSRCKAKGKCFLADLLVIFYQINLFTYILKMVLKWGNINFIINKNANRFKMSYFNWFILIGFDLFFFFGLPSKI